MWAIKDNLCSYFIAIRSCPSKGDNSSAGDILQVIDNSQWSKTNIRKECQKQITWPPYFFGSDQVLAMVHWLEIKLLEHISHCHFEKELITVFHVFWSACKILDACEFLLTSGLSLDYAHIRTHSCTHVFSIIGDFLRLLSKIKHHTHWMSDCVSDWVSGCVSDWVSDCDRLCEWPSECLC